MSTTTLKKITGRAKAIYKKGGTWQGAIKKAGAEYRSGKISGVKKKRKPVKRKKVGAVKRKAAPRKRVGAAPRKRTRPAKRAVGSVASHTKAAANILKEQLAWNLLNISQAKKKVVKRKLQKKSAVLKRKLKALSA
jgi:hypothetical protein